MIYCIPYSDYPERKDWRSEELIYKDENNFEWRIARVDNGFMIKYFGDEYFKEKMFICHLPNDKIIKIKNTNCIFVQDTDFDTFYLFRQVIKNGYTDEIWEVITDLFTERFLNCTDILECKKI